MIANPASILKIDHARGKVHVPTYMIDVQEGYKDILVRCMKNLSINGMRLITMIEMKMKDHQITRDKKFTRR